MISKRYNHFLQLLLVGETGVGKTCLLCRFASDDFVESDIRIDFKMKTMEMENETVKVQIWDTAGQERFEAIPKQVYRRAQGILMVFDICSRRSFEAIPKWLDQIKQSCEEHVVITMIGNKSDKRNERQVSFEEAQTFADKNKISFFEVSARNKNNIEKPFIDMCREIVSKSVASEKENTSNTIKMPSTRNALQKDEVSTNSASAGKPQAQGNWCCTVS